MNYRSHYDRLISRARTRDEPCSYVEIHHVVPRCLGGGDISENLVVLTPEEHFVAHQLLVKIHPDNAKLAYAVAMMTVSSPYAPRRNKSYGWIRRLVSEYKKQQIGLKHSEESKRKRSEKLKGKPLSEETKQKLKEAWIKRKLLKPMTDETKRKLSAASTGKKHSAETKAKLSSIRKSNPVKRKAVADAI